MPTPPEPDETEADPTTEVPDVPDVGWTVIASVPFGEPLPPPTELDTEG